MPGQQLRDAEAGQAVARVLGPAQAGERVLDVRRLQETQAAELHERDVAAPELDLQRVAVVGGAKQHGLLAQRHARLAPLEDPLDDVGDLRQLVADGGQHRAHAARAHGGQVLFVALAGGRERDHRVGGVQDRRRRTVVLLERDDRRGRIVLLREREDVADARGAEAVDRLRVVADDGDAAPVGLQEAQDLRLQRVGVLVFVAPARGRSGGRCAPPPTRPSSGETSRAADRRSPAPRAPPSRRRSRRTARAAAPPIPGTRGNASAGRRAAAPAC